MRVAIVGVGHWHAVQMYIPALQACGADIVAISDPEPGALERAGLDCARFLDHRELLASARTDFVFAMAPHCDMTAVAADLVDAGQAFAMEKPMGVDWRELQAVAQLAKRKGVFAAVALVTRYYALVEKLAELRDAGEIGRPIHYYSRLFAGTPQRYRDWHVGWMLDPDRAGAGPLLNFGPHVIDLYLYLFGDPIETVSAGATHALHGELIEDLASVAFRGESGALGVVEVSYTHPDSYERYFSVTTEALHIGGRVEGDLIRFHDGRRVDVEPDKTATETYRIYTADTLERFAQGRAPKASIHDMWPVLRVLNAAQRSIERQQPVRLAEVA